MHGLLTLSPVPPLSHLMEFASLIDFYDFERTDAEPREGAVSTSGIYRQERVPSLKMGIYGRDGKPSLSCQRTPSATMAPYRGASRYLRCGVRLQKEHGALQAKSNRVNALGLCGNSEARTRASGPGELKSNDSTRLN